MRFLRENLNRPAVALALLVVSAVVPAAFCLTEIARLNDSIARTQAAEAQAKHARSIVDQSGQSILNFAAATLDLTQDERQQVYLETDIHLRDLQKSYRDVQDLARRVLTAEEHADLADRIDALTHNLEEIHREAASGMNRAEETYHFLTVFDHTVVIRALLNRVEAAATAMAEEATAQSFSRVKMAGQGLAALMVLGGVMSAVAGIVMSLSARSTRLANERLTAANRELQCRDDRLAEQNAALVNMPVGLCMFDADRRLVLCNERYAAMYDLPPHLTHPGTPLVDILAHRTAIGNAPVDMTVYLAQAEPFALKSEPTTFQCELRDGRTVNISHNPMSDGGYVASHQDITASVEAQGALARAKEEAERARAEAEQANEAKSEFLASMSHEIRTPLNGVLGYADVMLEDTTLSAEQRYRLDRIQAAGGALLAVVNDILDFSKIEAGQIDLDARPFAPASVVDDAVSIMKGFAEKKRLDLAVRLGPGLPGRLVGDETRIRQILLNLLNNAVKFTARGGIVVDVACAPRPDGTFRLRFTVMDTGIGIPKDKQGRLFERFSQLDGSITREFGGTGLGLAICKRLVELMDGAIGVESEPGRGSTFWFAVDLPAASDKAEAGSDKAAPAGMRRSARILLVEDNDINREIACTVLGAAGHTVDAARDGVEAITAVQTLPYDLVLMDVQMPGMDGLTATRHIRSLNHPASRLPIVAMTANVLPQQIARFREAGMDDHVGKPFRREELYAVIERWAGVERGGEKDGREVA